MPFIFEPTELPEVILVKPKIFSDERGQFAELYKQSEFLTAGIPEFKQQNASVSAVGVVRALHYQLPPKAQGKLVWVAKGRIWDVAVDIRKSSQNFGKWMGQELSQENGYLLYVPPGFAHGFMSLEEGSVVVYNCTEEYSPTHERSIIYNDPDLKITWPAGNYQLAQKDAAAPKFKDAEVFN